MSTFDEKMNRVDLKCPNGHEVYNAPQSMTVCPVYKHGSPCKGELTSIKKTRTRKTTTDDNGNPASS